MDNRKKKGCLCASFTIEAALLVPILFAVIFLLLQTGLYLHDTVWMEAWLYERTWNLRWEQERKEEKEENENPQTGIDTDIVPNLAVLRYEDGRTVYHDGSFRTEAEFRICLLPEYITIIFTGQPEITQKQATEKILDTPGFIKIVGAIIEEQEEK